MARPSRAEMRRMAEVSERAAARSDASAADGDRAANDPSNSPRVQAQARTAAGFARNHAREYREEAELLRQGYLPGEDI